MGLSLKETAKLVNFVHDIKRAGKSAIFIDHNILHVYNVADRVVVIDRGQIAGEFSTKDITLDTLMEKMIRVAERSDYVTWSNCGSRCKPNDIKSVEP